MKVSLCHQATILSLSLWTDATVFPLVFYSSESDESAGWLYFSQLPDQSAPSFYDYAKETWVTPAGSQN